ncbi:MAG: hypothetical protein IT436_00425 [Phycisphaerales bacterium]|nr:hypothetical protein [Phycisphaerales bacterium]
MLGLAVVAAAGFAVTTLATPAMAGPPVCPMIYAPVKCDNGKVYMNQCYADRAHAKNCVPYFEP